MADLYEYGVALHLYKPIIKRGVVDFAVGADWTPVAGDVTISKDGGAAANVTNLPAAIVMGNSATWDFSLTAAELQAKKVRIIVADAAAKVVEDVEFEIDTYGNAAAQHAANLNDATSLGLSRIDATISSRASQASLDVVDDFVDTEVAAIKAKTDQLTFTTANKVDSTIQAAADFVQAAADKVWATATRRLTDGTNIVLAKGVGLTGLNDLDAAGVRGAVGLGAANLDTQLAAIAAFIDTEVASILAAVDTEVAAILAAVDTEVAAIKAKTDQLVFTVANQVDANALTVGDKAGYSLTADFRIKKNTALANFTFLMVDTTDVPATGLAITAQRSIDGGALGACANAVVEISNGLYKISLAAADLNGDVICLRFTAAGAKDRIITIITQTE